MKIMAKHKTEEHDFQCECVKWYRETFPEGIIFAVPNCGTRNIGTYYYMLNEGMTPGAPDLVLTKPDGKVIFVEMKSSKGRLSENQKSIQNQCENISSKLYFVCRSVEEFKSLFKEHLSCV